MTAESYASSRPEIPAIAAPKSSPIPGQAASLEQDVIPAGQASLPGADFIHPPARRACLEQNIHTPAVRRIYKRLAARLFSEAGVGAVAVRHLTASAGCNLAAVNYYFGSKEGLYREVFQRRLRQLRERRIASMKASSTP